VVVPKLRWEDGVDQDMRILGIKKLKKVALNRDEWAQLLKGPPGAVKPMMNEWVVVIMMMGLCSKYFSYVT
jgi:hypothetical protein